MKGIMPAYMLLLMYSIGVGMVLYEFYRLFVLDWFPKFRHLFHVNRNETESVTTMLQPSSANHNQGQQQRHVNNSI